MGRVISIVIGAFLIGLGLVLFTSVAMLVTAIYMTTVITMAVLSLIKWRRFMAVPSRDWVILNIHQELHSRKFGRLIAPFARMTHELLSLLNWPAEVLKSIYIGIIAKKIYGPSSFVSAQNLAPVILMPSFFTFVGLSLLVGVSDEFPLKLIAICLVFATYLSLISRSFFINVKEEVLSRPGNPKISFVIIAAYNFMNASLCRIIIADWSDMPAQTLGESAYAIFSLADFQTLGDRYGITLGSVFADPWVLAKFADVPSALSAMAVLDALFYLAFIRMGWEIISAKREPRHFIAHAIANLAIGRVDKAKAALDQARSQKEALVALSGIFLLEGNYHELAKAARRVCGIIGVEYSSEEEASIALLHNAYIQFETAGVVQYLSLRSATFRDPHTASLLAFNSLHVLPQSPETFERLIEFAGTRPDPLSASYVAYFGDEDEGTVRALAGYEPATPVEWLSYLVIATMSLNLKHVPNEALHDLEEALSTHLRNVPDASQLFPEHWQQILALSAVRRATVCYQMATDRSHPQLDELLAQVCELARQSDLIGEHLDTVTSVSDREMRLILAGARPGLSD